jgi:hypothetical protein
MARKGGKCFVSKEQGRRRAKIPFNIIMPSKITNPSPHGPKEFGNARILNSFSYRRKAEIPLDFDFRLAVLRLS